MFYLAIFLLFKYVVHANCVSVNCLGYSCPFWGTVECLIKQIIVLKPDVACTGLSPMEVPKSFSELLKQVFNGALVKGISTGIHSHSCLLCKIFVAHCWIISQKQLSQAGIIISPWKASLWYRAGLHRSLTQGWMINDNQTEWFAVCRLKVLHSRYIWTRGLFSLCEYALGPSALWCAQCTGKHCSLWGAGAVHRQQLAPWSLHH